MTASARRPDRRCDSNALTPPGRRCPATAAGVACVLVLAGCVTPPGPQDVPVTTGSPADEAQSDVALPEEPAAGDAPTLPTVDEAVVFMQPPDRCEVLIEDLEAAQPLLESLDAALAVHMERMQELTQRLEDPPAAPTPVECPDTNDGALGSMEIIGTIEWIWMNPPGAHYRARIDSGAETSSLSARNISEFERDGDDWVRFTFEHEATDESVEIEQPIVRTIIIRQPGMDGTERRVVVELDIRLGERLQRTEFALTDRSKMTYPVLLGRAFIRDLYVIDVARSYTQPRFEAP